MVREIEGVAKVQRLGLGDVDREWAGGRFRE